MSYSFGNAPVPPPTPTVTNTTTEVIHLVTRPVKWALFTAGGVVKWLGNTVQGVSQKL